jgi:alkylation response protein AidB-like acyl-CoA dehydrogenase
MDLTPTPEQKMLRDAAHKYLRAEYTFDARRQLLATETGMSAAHWRRFAEFGWLGLGLPEAHGGFGGMPDVVQVAEALGAALVVEPYFASTVLAGQAIAAAGNPTQCAALLPPLVSGEMIYTLAHTEADAGADLAWVASSARLEGGRWLLSGERGVPAPLGRRLRGRGAHRRRGG